MINPKELRLGNYILYTPGPSDIEMEGGNRALLSELQKFGVNFEIAKVPVEAVKENLINGLDSSQFTPILLTDEILKATGFNLNVSISHAHLSPMHLEKTTEGYYLYQTSGLINRNHPVLYVHQLQNLFYDISGKWLEIRF